jgi:hypothetical protein
MNKSQVPKDLLFYLSILLSLTNNVRSSPIRNCIMKSVLLYLIYGITQQFQKNLTKMDLNKKNILFQLYFHFSLVFCLNRHQYVILITLKQRFSTFWYSRTPKLEIFIKNCVESGLLSPGGEPLP